MPIPLAAAAGISAGADLLGGFLGSKAAKKASKRQAEAAKAQLALQQQMYYANLGINEPWRATGQGALNNLAKLYGLPYQDYQSATDIAQDARVGSGSGGSFKAKDIIKMMQQGMSIEDIAKSGTLKSSKAGKRINYLAQHGLTPEQIQMVQGGPSQFIGNDTVTNNLPQGGAAPAGPDMSVFTNSPGYQFRRDEGNRNIGNTWAARGGALSGNALKGITDFNQNLASEDYYDFINQMNNMAGLGQTATQNAGQYGSNYATGASNALGNLGDARASGIIGQSNAWTNAANNAGNAFSDYWANRTPKPPQNQYGGNSNRPPR